jgi:hypothetical protein
LDFEGLIDTATATGLERTRERQDAVVYGGAMALTPTREDPWSIADACREALVGGIIKPRACSTTSIK